MPTMLSTHLLPNLLETVQHRHTGDAVNLAERVKADWVEVLLPSNPGILDYGTGRVVHYHHSLVVLE